MKLAPLPESLQAAIDLLTDEGNELHEAGELAMGLERFMAALARFPEPAEGYQGGAAVIAAIADLHFSMRDFAAARAGFLRARAAEEGGEDSPWLSLRLGQIELELGESAEVHLGHALRAGGPELFDEEDPKYFAFITTRVPPPDGYKRWEDARLG